MILERGCLETATTGIAIRKAIFGKLSAIKTYQLNPYLPKQGIKFAALFEIVILNVYLPK